MIGVSAQGDGEDNGDNPLQVMDGGSVLDPHEGLKLPAPTATETHASKRQHHRGKGTSPRSPASGTQATPTEDPALLESRLVFKNGEGTYYRRACWVNDLERRSEGQLREVEQNLSSDRLCVYELGPGHNCSEVQYVESRACRPVTLHAAQASLASLVSKDRALSLLLRRLKDGPRDDKETLLSLLPLAPQIKEQQPLMTALGRWTVLKWVLALLRLEMSMAEEQGLCYHLPHMRLPRSRDSSPLAFYQRERAFAHYYRTHPSPSLHPSSSLFPPALPSYNTAPEGSEVASLPAASPRSRSSSLDDTCPLPLSPCSVGSKTSRPARRAPRPSTSTEPCGPPVPPLPVFLRIQLLSPFLPLDKATLRHNKGHWDLLDGLTAYTVRHAESLYTCCPEARANEALCPRRQGSDKDYYACGLPVVLALHALLPPTSPWHTQLTTTREETGEGEQGMRGQKRPRSGSQGGWEEKGEGLDHDAVRGKGEGKSGEVEGEGHRRLPMLPPTSPQLAMPQI